MTQRNGNQGASGILAPPPSPPPRPGAGLLRELLRAGLPGRAAPPWGSMAAVGGGFTLLVLVLGVYVGLCVAVFATF